MHTLIGYVLYVSWFVRSVDFVCCKLILGKLETVDSVFKKQKSSHSNSVKKSSTPRAKTQIRKGIPVNLNDYIHGKFCWLYYAVCSGCFNQVAFVITFFSGNKTCSTDWPTLICSTYWLIFQFLCVLRLRSYGNFKLDTYSVCICTVAYHSGILHVKVMKTEYVN